MAQYEHCTRCGKLFDADAEGVANNETVEFYCGSCYRKLNKKKQKSWFSRNWKWLIGGLLLIGCLGNITDTPEDSDVFVFIVLGLASLGLLVWGILEVVFEKKAERDAAKLAEKRHIERLNRERYIRDNTPRNCPYCGASTKGDRCEYCGSSLISPKEIKARSKKYR